MTPAGTSNALDVQDKWEENTHTHINTHLSESSKDERAPLIRSHQREIVLVNMRQIIYLFLCMRSTLHIYLASIMSTPSTPLKHHLEMSFDDVQATVASLVE